MYYVYVIQSERDFSFYKGQTNNLLDRVHRHNAGYETYTKKERPWRLIWFAKKATRSEAIKLERVLKKYSRKKVLELVEKYPITEEVTGLDVKSPLDF